MQVNDAVTGIIFTTQSNLGCLCRQITNIFIDGTSKSCPKFFDQVYSIHGCKHENYMPLVFALLPTRTQKCYAELWTLVIRICEERHLILCPDAIHIDFEQSMISVIVSVFPATKIKCCRRRIQELGLSAEYEDEEGQIGKWLKIFFGFP